MHRRLLFGVIALIAAPCLAQAEDDPCLKAVDYKGCKEYQSGQTFEKTSGNVEVNAKSDHNYRPSSVRQQKVRGSYGRYISFVGTTLNEYAGTPARYNPGSPGRRVCNTTYGFNNQNKTTTCQQVGYVAPSYTPGTPGGVERRSFRYQLDCKDLTFDRKGDTSGFGNKGWMGVDNDPTAQAVADRYCTAIDSVPKQVDYDAED